MAGSSEHAEHYGYINCMECFVQPRNYQLLRRILLSGVSYLVIAPPLLLTTQDISTQQDKAASPIVRNTLKFVEPNSFLANLHSRYNVSKQYS
jgi:hypothetical protein